MKVQIASIVALIATCSAGEYKLKNGLVIDRNFWEGLLTTLLTPIGNALQTSAELAAQLTAAIAVGGIDALTGLFGKRDVEYRNFWEGLLTTLLTPIGNALQTSAELAAQLTAAIAVGGIDALTGLFGKRDVQFRNFWEGLLNVLLTPIGNALQTSAELAAQLTAAIAVGGIDALTGLFGKRSVDTKFLDLLTGILGDYYNNVISPVITDASQSLALMAAQLLAGVAEGGLPALMNLLG